MGPRWLALRQSLQIIGQCHKLVEQQGKRSPGACWPWDPLPLLNQLSLGLVYLREKTVSILLELSRFQIAITYKNLILIYPVSSLHPKVWA